MRRLLKALLWIATLVLCGMPFVAALWPAVTRPTQLGIDGDVLRVTASSVAAAVVATALAAGLGIGPAWLMRRGGKLAVLVATVALATLAIPEAAWAYGTAEATRTLVGVPRPGSLAAQARGIVATALHVWPVPAAVLAVAWSRLPTATLDAAALDGATGRITTRLLIGPLVAGCGGALLLAGRNVVAYDAGGVVTTGLLVRERFGLATGDRTAASVGAGLPMMLTLAAVATLAWWWFTRQAADARESDARLRLAKPQLPRSAGLIVGAAASGMMLAIPLVALVVTGGKLGLVESWPQWATGLAVAGVATLYCGVLCVLATLARPAVLQWLAVATFLIGGQFVALGLIRLFAAVPEAQPLLAVQDVAAALMYNRLPWFAWASAALLVFIPLAAAGATWTGPNARLRDVAAIDGASPVQTAAYVVWPVAWPGLVAALLATFALALGETHAAVLTFPGTLVNTMMGNVHTLAYGPMARAALLSATTAVVVSMLAVAVYKLGARWRPVVAGLVCLVVLAGCDGAADTPDEVLSGRGAGDGQVVYPRAVAYSAADDSYWVIDRTARVQQLDATTGKFIVGWPMPQNDYGRPVGVSVDTHGNVWVPDTHYGRVIVYAPDGTEQFRFGQSGTAPGEFIWPTDVLVLDDDRVLVSEYGAGEAGNNDRVQLFERIDDTWTATASIGSFGIEDGQFRRPQSMAKVGDTLWVTDAANHRLVAFSLNGDDFGTFKRFIGDGGASSEPGRFRFPYGLDADADGHLIVAEFGNNRVQKIDPQTGESLGLWGAFGARQGELRYPWAITSDTKRGRSVIVDSGNDRLQAMRF